MVTAPNGLRVRTFSVPQNFSKYHLLSGEHAPMKLGNAAFRIGEWRVDPTLDEISRDGSTVKPEPRTMRLLVSLAGTPAKSSVLRSYSRWCGRISSSRSFSVYQAVALLRRALQDDPKNPTYIANLARRGYRLVAAIGADTKTQEAVLAPATPVLQYERCVAFGTRMSEGPSMVRKPPF